MLIGSHCGMSSPLYYLGTVKEALSYNATCFMVYTGSPQTSIRMPLERLMIPEALKLMKDNNLDGKVIIHAPYIINPATDDLEKRKFCIEFLSSEIIRSYEMGSRVIVLHPGNSLKLDLNTALDNIASVVNAIIRNTKEYDVVIALETMAGKGSECGKTFEEIKYIIDKVDNKQRIGVCLDTCHIHDAGYDIVNEYEKTKEEFKSIIGLNFLKVIHLNDSKNERGSHKDRHANIGQGFIGLETLKKVAKDPELSLIPKILETPYINGIPPYKEEIEIIRK